MRSHSLTMASHGRGWLVLAGLLALVASASAEPSAPDSAAAPAPPVAGTTGLTFDGTAFTPAPAGSESPVVFGNRTITILRAEILGRLPAERARAATDNIRQVLGRARADSVTIQAIPEAFAIAVAGEPVLLITHFDLDPVAGKSLETTATEAAANLRLAITEYREQRSLQSLLRAIGATLIATILAVLLARVIARLRNRFIDLLERMAAKRLGSQPQTPETLAQAPARHLARALGRGVDAAGIAVGLLIVYAWLAFCLRAFPYTRPWGEQLRGYLLQSVGSVVNSAVRALPGLFTVIVIFFVTRSISRVVNHFFNSIEHGTSTLRWIEPEIASPTRRIANVLVWLFALLIAYPYLPGSGTEAFKGLSVFIGLIVSLGSSGVVNQAMSGFVLMYSRMLKKGDWVLIGTTEGMVTSLGLLSTKIKTRLREEVSIPNSVVLSDTTKNYSRYQVEGLFIAERVSISYSAPWRQIHAMLKLAAARTQGLRSEPKPIIRQIELGDFYVVYELNAAVENPGERIATLTRLRAHIQDEFNRHGVQIMSPHYEGDPERPAIVPVDQWHAAPASAEDDGNPG
jgi:small-conductance mechanosensitive channel